jgi:serine/threonine-protein kinase
VGDDRPLAEIELRDAADRVDRLSDSLTVRLLRELGRTRHIEVFRTTSMGSKSVPALKAFLRGEQWFRRASWDSALAAYGGAIALDSTFALALWRSSLVLGWQRWAGDSLSTAQAMQAGALTHGLAPRDSLLVTGDSILAALNASVPYTSWRLVRRLHMIAQELTERYPDDVESWYALGEARYHWGFPVGSNARETLEAFDRAIQLDSSFAPAYIHPVELALWLDGAEAGHRYASRYLALGPTDAAAAGIRLADRLVTSGAARPDEARRLLNEAAPSALRDARNALTHASDSAEWAVQVARAMAAAPIGDAAWVSRAERELTVGTSLLYRGHLRQAVEIIYRNPEAHPIQMVEAALLTSALPDSANRTFHSMLTSNRLVRLANTLPWWTARRDSAAIREIERRCDSAARAAPSDVERNIALHTSQAARAYLALVRRDTTDALRQFESLPDTLCVLCYFPRLALAQLLSARHDDQKANLLLNREAVDLTLPSEILWILERGRVAERLGNREKAIRSYQYVAHVWRSADPELQPYVAEAREGLARLTSEPKP